MTHQSPAIIQQKTLDIIPESIFPNDKNEIQDWALKYGIINSYDNYPNESIAGLSCVGRFQKKLLETLIQGNPISENQKEFMKKSQQVVQLLRSSTIGEGIKKTIIDTIATDNNTVYYWKGNAGCV